MGPGTGVRSPGSGASRLSGGHAFRGPGFRSAFMLLGGHASPRLPPCFQEARLSGGHASPGLPGVRASLNFFFFAASAPSVFASQPPGFRLSGFQGTGDRGPGTGDQAFRGPGFPPCYFSFAASLGFVCYIKINAAGCFQQRPIMYVMSPSSFLHKYTHFQDITPRFFSFFRISIQFVA